MANCFDVPISMLQSEDSNRATAQESTYQHQYYGIAPRCCRVDSALTHQLVKPIDERQFVAFDDPVQRDKQKGRDDLRHEDQERVGHDQRGPGRRRRRAHRRRRRPPDRLGPGPLSTAIRQAEAAAKAAENPPKPSDGPPDQKAAPRPDGPVEGEGGPPAADDESESDETEGPEAGRSGRRR